MGKHQHTSKNLVRLDADSVAVKQANDINSKLNTLEDSLAELQTELDTVNKSVEVGMETLSSNDLDLTAKVSETYKRLGDIDNTFQSLAAISSEIDSEVKKLTVEIADVAEQSATELENLEATSSGQYTQINEQHEQLSARVNNLVKSSQDTHTRLNESIKQNADALLSLKQQLIGEIDNLTTASQDRDDELDAKLSEAEKNIASNQANILKMQAVDAALDKRAIELEQTTAMLTEQSTAHQAALQQLDYQAEALETSVRQLQEKASKHEEQIIELQVNTAVMGRNHLALASKVKQHFWASMAMLALVVLLIGGTSYYQDAINTSNVQQFSEVQTDLEAINQNLVAVGDQLSSMDGRLSYSSPYSEFGMDNTLHGPQWLAAQAADRFAIQVASATSKKELYTITQRYSHYFTDNVSYYKINTAQGERYVLVYGSFANHAEAASVMWQLPRQINYQRPVISRIGDIQASI